jgi:hypothetical protein
MWARPSSPLFHCAKPVAGDSTTFASLSALTLRLEQLFVMTVLQGAVVVPQTKYLGG